MLGEPTILAQSGSRGELILQRIVLRPLAVVENLCPASKKVLYSRPSRVLIESVLIAMSVCAAYLIRFDGVPPPPYEQQVLMVLPLAILLYLAASLLFEDHKRTWRFFGMRDAIAMSQSLMVGFAISIAWRLLDRGMLAGKPVPVGVLLVYPLLTFAALVGVRTARRALYHRSRARIGTATDQPKRLLLIGAGEAGLLLLHDLRATDFKVVGFLDDDLALQSRRVCGWQVLGTTHDVESVVRTCHVDEVVLCIPSASKGVLQRIVAACEKVPVPVKSVPTLAEIMAGNVAIGQLRPIRMERLLGRDTVSATPDLDELKGAYSGRRILVTGAGGSIGSELVRQLRRFRPLALILLDKDENNLYEVACEIREDFDQVVDVIADIRDRGLIQKLFELHKPDVVFHAAAYKHVPLMEHHPAEAILNNVMGTRHVAEAAHRCGVETFVLISTDKAVNPSSMMGASKRVAEMIVQQLASANPSTRFCCVRFGNVLGSRASVVPIFQRQISRGKNITVTHPDVRRYFMTIPEAVQLVIQAGSLGKRGEIFLLDMGDPVKIVDLARNLIELSGLIPGKDVTIEFTGLRPGEKLNEELLVTGERGVRSTRYSKIFVVEALSSAGIALDDAVKDLEIAARAGDVGKIYERLEALDIGYRNSRARNYEARHSVSAIQVQSVPEIQVEVARIVGTGDHKLVRQGTDAIESARLKAFEPAHGSADSLPNG